MIPVMTPCFRNARLVLAGMMKAAPLVDQHRWQGNDVRDNPAARCYEARNVVLSVDLRGEENLDRWREDIRPNLPWADDHFLERVGGEPLNPGEQWKNWPWAGSADTFRRGDERFNHSYMERLWPRYARRTPGGKLWGVDPGEAGLEPRQGIDRPYGDLYDVVKLLSRDPWTRQAYIPLFYPEDTGWGDGGRKMCSLGYQFLRRGDRLNIFYPLRSCDFSHHWADDCYLAVRLLLWVLERVRAADPTGWAGVVPGDYAMWMTSLHVFENDRRKL